MNNLKLIITIVLASFISWQSYSQNAYYDAIKLKSLTIPTRTGTKFDPSEIDSVLKILQPYTDSNNGVAYTIDDNIKHAFDLNPFLHPLMPGLPQSGNNMGAPNVNSLLTKAGGVDVTNITNALADLMIDRAKQELTIAFFNRFDTFVSKHPEFRILFPKTCDNLNHMLAYSYPTMLPTLRKGFIEDLDGLTYNLQDLLTLPRYNALLTHYPELKLVIRSIKIAHELETGASNAADVITELSTLPEWTDPANSQALRNMGTALKLANIFSQSLRADTIVNTDNAGRIWISGSDIKKMLNNDTATQIYLGLIYQQLKNNNLMIIYGSSSLRLDSLLASQMGNVWLIQNKLAQFHNIADKVNTSYKDIKKKKADGTKLSNDDINGYITVSTDAAEYALGLVKIFDTSLQADTFISLIRKTNDVYKYTYTHQYRQAIAGAIDIFTIVSDIETHTTHRTQHDNFTHVKDFMTKAKPYMEFMADIATAETSDDIEKVLNNAILPVGSSAIKKYSRVNVSIQSYLGVNVNLLTDNSSTVSRAWTDRVGITAPIGISWTPNSWGKGVKGAHSIFLSLFDIGAIVDYKLRTDSTQPGSNGKPVALKENSITLANIVSPGLYYVYGFCHNLPLSLGIGAQYGPGLSKVNTDGTTIAGHPSWRGNIFLAVDLPFFNIYNRKREEKKD